MKLGVKLCHVQEKLTQNVREVALLEVIVRMSKIVIVSG